MNRPIKCYCGERFIRTPSGWCCPNGHGKLHLASRDDDIDERLVEIEQREFVKPVIDQRDEMIVSLEQMLEHIANVSLDRESRRRLKRHCEAAVAFIESVDSCLSSFAELDVQASQLQRGDDQ